MSTICPYCNIEVNESMIESEDGCCPECGSLITVSSIFGGDDHADAYEEDDFDDLDEDELDEDVVDEDALENKLFGDDADFGDDDIDFDADFEDDKL